MTELDYPFTGKDKLLKNDFPKPEHFRPMSGTESQEKMVLWKLRCSATRQKSSNVGVTVDGQGKGNREVEKSCAIYIKFTCH